ncbi:hypothetical protein PGUG_03101 [Meyerozyma guilliermondii ATCC 6260]|uniref:HTH La-type RNA-binding domain-containing protein n=1 Tax=Meyerozyma guilliermondii (strain ATCC 6260 / CBS 566 / DSM 6381 / JCM 1539 / NBRC 10279 / NRRL Y-324) TaxID=294746 RepID=A5DIK0_PICGU|nr:uncharacterized protein PGUG_03101 [Meyerozyma guilliermondii ATCC 6260]EDK39003.1 hypothetical protein PGUG_03101 [Meyerozyma guilliermondii ATCC 6260]
MSSVSMSDSVYKGSDFDEKVRKQVEFYFSDSNLQTDKFLWRIYEANDGWVELKTILTFGRMRQYRPEDKVIEALKASDKLVLSSNNDMIRRKDPLKDFNELKNTRRRNSVHIEGFPKDATQEDLEEWFSTKIVPKLPVEKALCSIRRHRTKAGREFLGIADVEFKTQEDAEYFLNELNVSYPDGILDGDNVEGKDVLKKMSLLTYKELKEGGKRFGVNEVTKRRSSFNDSRGKKKFKGRKDKTEGVAEEVKEDESTETTETTDEKEPKEKEEKEEESDKPAKSESAEGTKEN